MQRSLYNRRSFTRGLTASLLAAATAPQILKGQTLGLDGGVAASNRIRTAHFGVGGQGTGLLKNFLGLPNCQPVMIVDPFGRRRDAAAQLVKEKHGSAPALAADYRTIIASKDFDACVIATPDHWHVALAMAAIKAGKDVYVEKPLGYSLRQNLAIRELLRGSDRIFQYGTQQRAQGHIKKGVELVMNGALGKIQRVEIWAPSGSGGGGSLEEIPVPEDLDYEMYIGPAPMRPCTKDRITSPASWYSSDYAIGFIAGWGAHPLDVFILALESDTKGPIKVKATGTFPPAGGLFDTCNEWESDFTFADGLKMEFRSFSRAAPVVAKYRDDNQADGTTFFGENGWLSLSRGGFQASDNNMMRGNKDAGPKKIIHNPNYYQGFIDSVANRTPSMCGIEDAFRSDLLSHLPLLALTHQTEVIWDPAKSMLVGPGNAAAWMEKPMRPPHTLG